MDDKAKHYVLSVMTTDQQQSALTILHNMALERKGFWNSIFRRWFINDEPLRNDAANLLRRIGKTSPVEGCRYVGDDDD